MTIPKDWPSLLVTKALDPHFIRELQKYLTDEQFLWFAKFRCDSAEDAKDLDAFARTLHSALPGELMSQLMRQVAAIKKDQAWSVSRRGQYILEINRWAEPFYAEFRSMPEFADVFIGGYTRQDVVLVSGTVTDQAEWDRLVDYVNSKNPPFKVLINLKFRDDLD
jgi:hypothetical protein